jgi:hypothetical protein
MFCVSAAIYLLYSLLWLEYYAIFLSRYIDIAHLRCDLKSVGQTS